MNTAPDKLSHYFSLQLESLRGISAIVVLFSHCFQAFIAPFDTSIYSWIRLLGQAAVMIFFALSGYLIGYSIQHNIHQHGQFNLHRLCPTAWPQNFTAFSVCHGLDPAAISTRAILIF